MIQNFITEIHYFYPEKLGLRYKISKEIALLLLDSTLIENSSISTFYSIGIRAE